MKNGKWIPVVMLLVVGGLLFLAMRYTEPGRQFADAIVGCPHKENAAAYDALMKQVAGGAPPDTILATAFDKLNRGMTEDQVREVVEEHTKNWVVSSSRTTPPDGKESEIRLLWRRYGEFAQKDHSCEELNVDLGVDGSVKPGGIIYVGNYTLGGERREQLWKQK